MITDIIVAAVTIGFLIYLIITNTEWFKTRRRLRAIRKARRRLRK